MLINKHVLSNGLRLLHVLDDTTPMVAVNVLYDVGSKDESPDHTGLAHLIEHLMFGGSPSAPNFDAVMQDAGGENNAFTSPDITNFYDILPRENIETAFFLESDRMRSLLFSQQSLDVQRKVVCEEFKERNLNKPYGDLLQVVYSTVFTQHPYRWQPIGLELGHIQKTTLDDFRSFFYSHYLPNNAILSVVGNVDFCRTVKLANKWFGSIPARNFVARSIAPEPVQTQPRFRSVLRNVPHDVVYKVFRCPSVRQTGYYVCDFITDLLSLCDSSRLSQHLVRDRHMFNNVECFVGQELDEGLIFFKGRVADGVAIELADKALWDEIMRFCSDDISPREMQKICNVYEADKLYPASIDDVAADIALWEVIGDANLYNQRIAMHNAVTVPLIREVASRVFSAENCSTIFYRAKGIDF